MEINLYLLINLLASLLMAGKVIYDLQRIRSMPATKLMPLLWLLGAGFFAGQVLKELEIGPQFVRWHLADFCAPIALGLIISFSQRSAMLGEGAQLKEGHTLISSEVLRLRRKWDTAYLGRLNLRRGVAITLLASGACLYQIVGKRLLGGRLSPIPVNTTDWIDVVAYLVGAVVAIWILIATDVLLFPQKHREPIRDTTDYSHYIAFSRMTSANSQRSRRRAKLRRKRKARQRKAG